MTTALTIRTVSSWKALAGNLVAEVPGSAVALVAQLLSLGGVLTMAMGAGGEGRVAVELPQAAKAGLWGALKVHLPGAVGLADGKAFTVPGTAPSELAREAYKEALAAHNEDEAELSSAAWQRAEADAHYDPVHPAFTQAPAESEIEQALVEAAPYQLQRHGMSGALVSRVWWVDVNRMRAVFGPGTPAAELEEAKGYEDEWAFKNARGAELRIYTRWGIPSFGADTNDELEQRAFLNWVAAELKAVPVLG